MQVHISARHGQLKAEAHAYISEKVEKLGKYHDHISRISVTVELAGKETVEAEVRVTIEHAGEFVATDRAAEITAAFDGAEKKIEQQIKKHKEKITNHHKPLPKTMTDE